jgi:puromycin-sensitive aminopeptidase
VAADLAQNLAGLDSLLADEPYHPEFQAFARGVFAPIGRRMGWDARPGEGHLDALLRSTVIETLGRYEDPDTLAEAASRLDGYALDPSSVDPDIRRAVFGLSAKQGNAATWETLWGLYQDAALQEEKVRLLVSMTQFKQPDLLQMTLERSMSDDVRSQDAIYGLVGTGSNSRGRDLAWEFVKDRWDDIYRMYGEGGFMIMRLVSFTSGFSTEEKLREVEEFFDGHPAPAAERSIRQSLERIRLNIAWLDRNRTDLAAWFDA